MKRLVAELPDEEHERIQQLKQATGADSAKQVVLSALRLYDYLLRKESEGWEILLAKGDRERAVQLFLGQI